MSDRLPQHTLYAVRLPYLLRLLRRYRPAASRLPRVATLLTSSCGSAPLRWIDWCRSAGKVAKTQIDQPPVFVVGHPRSGTTHLHNLLCRDPRFGTVTTFHCGAADTFLGATGLLRKVMGRMLPASRPMDNVAVGLDEPQEEELAMARLSPLSYNHCLHFPNDARDIFDRCVMFRNQADTETWKEDYLWFLRRVTLDQGERPLCLKSPPNMARIKQLLELFPNAKFIHIYRDPYVVFRSSINLWQRVLPMLSLQDFDVDKAHELVLPFYREMHERYFETAADVPQDQLIEVRFESLEEDPLGELQRIYDTLSLGDFATAEPPIRQYVDSLADYKKNKYQFDPEMVAMVNDNWQLTIDRWNYAQPETV